MPGGPSQQLADARHARRLLKAVAIAGSLCAGVKLLAAKLLVALLYHPSKYQDIPDHGNGLLRYADAFRSISYRLEKVEYPAGAGGLSRLMGASASRRDCALLLQPEGSAASGLWAVFGGNAMVASDWLHFFLELLPAHSKEAQPRPAFLLVDYPGYGANGGQPSPKSVLAGQLAALRAAVPKLESPPARLHLLGHSLGAAAASQLAAHLRAGSDELAAVAGPSMAPGRLVLSAPFVSIEAMAQALFGAPGWILRLLVSHRWNNAEWVPLASKSGWRVSIVHGTRDNIVPVSMGRSLRDAVRSGGEECEFVEIPKAGHNDVMAWSEQYATLLGLAPRGSSL